MLNVLILGYGPMGLGLLRGCLTCHSWVNVVGVFPWSRHPDEQNAPMERCERSFVQFIRSQRIPLLLAPSANHFQFVKILNQHKPDVVLVGSWGEIIQKHILEIPDILFINCHPSLLPRHRGANPYTAVILANEIETGITFHEMDTSIDTGPILMQTAFTIDKRDTGGHLREKAALVAEKMLPVLLAQVRDGRLVRTHQPASHSQYYDKVSATNIWISWQTETAQSIMRKYQAFSPWQRIYTRYGKYTMSFGSAETVSRFLCVTQSNEVFTPGRLLKFDSQGVWVLSKSQEEVILLKKPILADYPLFYGKILLKMILKPGTSFDEPPENI